MTATKGKILIVEDEFIQFLSLQELMEEHGYEVCGPASTGVEALDMARASIPDLVLMDVSIQGAQDGIDTARDIGERFGIPVILTTGYDSPEVYQKACNAKTAGFLLKPYEIGELIDAIEAALKS